MKPAPPQVKGVEKLADALVPEVEPIEAPMEAPAQPEQKFQRLDFNSMPGVALILPDPCPPGQMVRILAKIQEDIGMHIIRATITSALGA